MVNIVLTNQENKSDIIVVAVKDESTAMDVINRTRYAVAGINKKLDVIIKKDDVMKIEEAVATIMQAAVNCSTPFKDKPYVISIQR